MKSDNRLILLLTLAASGVLLASGAGAQTTSEVYGFVMTDVVVNSEAVDPSWFDVQRATGMLSGSPDVPYRYVEILRVASVEALRTNIAATPAMAEVARQFREFADAPQFIVTEAI